MSTLYVIRHAEPLIKGVLLGQSDPPLSDVGRRQAATLRAEIPAGPVYTSPLQRALQTARFLSDSPIILPKLAEISYGEWNGLTWTEIERLWPDVAQRKLGDWDSVTPPGGESWRQFQRRVAESVQGILGGSMPAVMVAHEAVNAVVRQELTLLGVHSYKQQYCEIKRYDP